MTQKDKWEVSNWFLTPNEPQRSYTFISYHYKSVMMKLRKIQNLELNTAVMCVYIKKKGKHNRCWKQTNCLWSLLLTVLTNNTISLLLTELINNTNRREEKKRSVGKVCLQSGTAATCLAVWGWPCSQVDLLHTLLLELYICITYFQLQNFSFFICSFNEYDL